MKLKYKVFMKMGALSDMQARSRIMWAALAIYVIGTALGYMLKAIPILVIAGSVLAVVMLVMFYYDEMEFRIKHPCTDDELEMRRILRL